MTSEKKGKLKRLTDAFLSPLYMLIAIFLLWWNPEKYKEYEMKQFRKEKEKLKQ